MLKYVRIAKSKIIKKEGKGYTLANPTGKGKNRKLYKLQYHSITMTKQTTIQISKPTWRRLFFMKSRPSQTFDEIIRELLDFKKEKGGEE